MMDTIHEKGGWGKISDLSVQRFNAQRQGDRGG